MAQYTAAQYGLIHNHLVSLKSYACAASSAQSSPHQPHCCLCSYHARVHAAYTKCQKPSLLQGGIALLSYLYCSMVHTRW